MKAAVFVDVQNDFLKGGKLQFGWPEKDNLDRVVEFAKSCIEDGDFKLYATLDTHQKTEDQVIELRPGEAVIGIRDENGVAHRIIGYMSTLEGEKLPVEHCIEGSDGWQITDKLMDEIYGKCTFVNKKTFGSFDLAELIEEDFGKRGPEEIIICGYDLSICVLANAVILRAKFPDVKISVKLDACGDVDKEAFDAAAKTLAMQMIEVY